MQYRSVHDERKRFYTNPGSKFAPNYKVEVEDGQKVLVEDGTVCLYDEIQSHAESVSMATVLARFAHGDVSALQMRKAVYGDTGMMPKDLRAMLDAKNLVQAKFDALTAKEKAEFGSLDNYLAAQLQQLNFPTPSKESEVVENAVQE